MKKIVLIGTILVLVFSIVYLVKKNETEKLDYQIQMNKLRKQNKELKTERKNELFISEHFSTDENIDVNRIENILVKDGLSEKILLENKKIIDVLFNYNDFNTRQETINMYITDVLKDRMIKSNKSIDMHDIQIDSKLIGSDSYMNWEADNKFTTLNIVDSNAKIGNETTKLRTIVKLNYFNLNGVWKVSNISFFDIR
ncbi:hypothetical protein JT279_001731 [Listeria monocytogenes]|uniref:hypothetical protein n=1 Tax=Listeria monocytogenes TaxID=1639 RepID=UPI000E6BAE42|nr:hypothetical protein [Listeria monocytogenes]MBC1624143.1 hypothetical protein [Listeria welshimeri]EHB7034384.1 hypothetical protein [Listeria monocytogenes]EHB7062941.1 hypothetical protein [Listeria monocytogenes]EHB7141084.1 hypothetical protein [Listeria monocytogenes]EHB7149720.1 hypothetical protein [Listeria monocytogenes]